MTIRTRLLVASLSMLSLGIARAEAIPDNIKEQAIALRDNAMQKSIAYDVVESLTMEVGPRSAGSTGDAAAVRWAVEKLKSLGFRNVHTDEVVVPHWDRGTLDVRITAPYPQSLVATALGGSAGTPAEGIEAEVVRVESLAELRALSQEQLQGRIAYVDHVMERLKTGAGYGVSTRIRI